MRERSSIKQKRTGAFHSLRPRLFCLLAIGLSFSLTGCGLISDLMGKEEGSLAPLVVEESSSEVSEASSEAEESRDVPEVVQMAEDASGFAYDTLNDAEKILYACLLTGVSELRQEFGVYVYDGVSCDRVITAFAGDHPEFFWLDGTATIRGYEGETVKTISLGFDISADAIPEAKAKIEAARQAFYDTLPEEVTNYQIVKAAYDYLITQTDYDATALQGQNIQSVFLNGRSVCAGYAKAFKYLMDGAGIPCAYISGTSVKTGESHAWNYVVIDGVGTYVDATWGDPTYAANADRESLPSSEEAYIDHDFLCLTSNEIVRFHSFANSDMQYASDDRSYDFYILNNRFFTSYDPEALSALFTEAVNSGERSVMMKFSHEEDFRSALTALEEGSLTETAFQAQMTLDGTTQMSYSYRENENLYTLTIFW